MDMLSFHIFTTAYYHNDTPYYILFYIFLQALEKIFYFRFFVEFSYFVLPLDNLQKMYYNVKIENRREGFTIMDAFTEFLGELTGKLSGFEDIIAASALILIDVCALVIIAFCSKEKKAVQQQWNRAARHMILTDTEGGFTFTLNSQEILMGRHISADLRFPDLSVSRYHALLSLEDGVWTLTDLESKSGTYVNGMKIKQQRLRNNDEIRIGKKTLYIRRVKPQNV